MAYRDELEALRAHADRLEEENAALRRENEALRAGAPAGHGQSTARAWLGGPVRIDVERALEGELPAAAHERVVEILRTRFGMIGETSVIGGTLAWKVGRPAAQRAIEVTVTARGGRTRLRVVERLGDLAGGLFGGIVGGAGGGGMGAVIPIGMMVDPVLALALAPAWVGAVYGIVRAAYGGVSRGREREIESVARELEEAIRSEIAASAPRVRVEPAAEDARDADARDGAQVAPRSSRA